MFLFNTPSHNTVTNLLVVFIFFLIILLFIFINYYVKTKSKKQSKNNKVVQKSIFSYKNPFENLGNQIKDNKLYYGKIIKDIFDLNPAIMALVTLNEEIFVDVNESFLKILEFGRNEVIGKSALELGLHIDYSKRELMFKILNKDGVIKDFKLNIKTKNGLIKNLVFNGSKITIKNENYFLAIVTDITDYIEKEISLNESKKNLLQLFEFSPVPLCITDIENFKIIKSNISACKLLNLNYNEIENTEFSKLLNNLDYSLFIKHLITEDKVVDLEAQIFNTNGDKKWVLISADSIEYYGEKVWLIGIIDITIRKKIESDLKFSELKFMTAFNNMPSIMVISDIVNGEIIDINNSFENIFGVDKKNVIGQKVDVLQNFFLKNDLIMIGKLLRTNGAVENYHTTYCYNEGNCKHFHFSAFLFDIDDKKFSLNIITDISEFITTDNALKQSEENYRMIVENTTNGIYILKNSKFIFFNKRMQQALGYSREELINIDVMSLVYSEDRNKLLEVLLKRKKNKNSPITYETRIITKNGELRNCIFTTKEIKYNNEDAVLGIVHDITELRNAENELIKFNRYLEDKVEEELKKREKQENILIQKSKLEFLGEMAAGMAHEINQPLTGISMAMENLLNKFSKNEINYQYYLMKVSSVFDYIDRIKKIIEHVRIFSRDQQSGVNEVFSINEVIKNALSLIEKPYQALGITISTIMGVETLFIKGNKYRLEQVILNLLSNSKDALLEKSKKYSNKFDKKIEIIVGKNNNWVWFEIKDNGIGIENSKIDNIFNPFYTSKDADKGTGLGLSIVYGIINEFNGDIYTESKPNIYTLMKIILPSENVLYEKNKNSDS